MRLKARSILIAVVLAAGPMCDLGTSAQQRGKTPGRRTLANMERHAPLSRAMSAAIRDCGVERSGRRCDRQSEQFSGSVYGFLGNHEFFASERASDGKLLRILEADGSILSTPKFPETRHGIQSPIALHASHRGTAVFWLPGDS